MTTQAQRSKTRQISVRIGRDTDVWLEKRAGGQRKKAAFVRRLIEKEKACEKEEALLRMFNEAAEELEPADREEREILLGAFVAEDEAERS